MTSSFEIGTGWKGWLKNAAMLLLLAVYTACLAEIVIRIIQPQALMPRYVTDSPWGIRTNIADAQYRHVTPDVDVQYRINSQGMRSDRDFGEAKPEGICRIAMLGDSYFMGYELALEDSLAAQVEKHLTKFGYNVEVLNLSVSGFGTAESLIRYQSQGRKFAPDLVLLEWQVTDFDDNSRSQLYRLEDGKPVRWKRQYLPSIATQKRLNQFAIYRVLADNSHLYALAREQIAWKVKQLLAVLRKNDGATDADRGAVQNGGYSITQNQRRISSILVGEMNRIVDADGAKLLLLDIPNRTPPKEFSTSYDLLNGQLIGDIPAVEPLSALREAAQDDEKRIFFANGARHLTPFATQLIARLTAEKIERQGMLSESCKSQTGKSE